MISLVVFDMAGTTVNEDNVVYKTLYSTLLNSGCPVTWQEVLTHGAGREKRDAIEVILQLKGNSLEKKDVDYLYKAFIQQLSAAYLDCQMVPMDGALYIFEKLKLAGIKVVLNTGYDSRTANQILYKLGWHVGKEIDGLICADDVEEGRPSPQMIYKAMKLFNIDSASAVAKVGDTTIDILEGKNAGCRMTIGLTAGAHSREMLEQVSPDFIFDSLYEVADRLVESPIHE